MKYRTGTLYNHAVWLKHSFSLTCPLCPQLDSALHVLSGCQYTQISNFITERHNLACSMIFKAISKTGSLGPCFVCMDIGSSERLAIQIFRIPIQLKPGLYQSGSFQPASHTKIGFTSSRPDAVLVAPISVKIKKQQTRNDGFLKMAGGN